MFVIIIKMVNVTMFIIIIFMNIIGQSSMASVTIGLSSIWPK